MNRLPRTIRRAALVSAAVVAVLFASTGPAAATEFTWDTAFTRLAVFPGTPDETSESTRGAMTAICVLRDNRVPIDCVGVDRSEPTRVPGVFRIATTDPRLQVPTIVLNQIPGTTPSCGNCV